MQFAANTHCILSGTLPDIINENHKTLWHIHYVRFSPSSVSRFPPSASAHRRFAYSFRAAHSVLSLSLSSPLRDKITTTNARASTVDFWIIVPRLRFSRRRRQRRRIFDLLFLSVRWKRARARRASSHFHGKRGRADVNYRIALSIQWFMRITSIIRTVLSRSLFASSLNLVLNNSVSIYRIRHVKSSIISRSYCIFIAFQRKAG